MDEKAAQELAGYRLQQAQQCLVTAGNNLREGDYKAAANRSYYAVFHGMRAVLALDGVDSKKHSGIISEFQRRYIKEHCFPVEFSDIIRKAFRVRSSSDYDDFFILSKSEVEEQIKNADKFLRGIVKYLLEITSS